CVITVVGGRSSAGSSGLGNSTLLTSATRDSSPVSGAPGRNVPGAALNSGERVLTTSACRPGPNQSCRYTGTPLGAFGCGRGPAPRFTSALPLLPSFQLTVFTLRRCVTAVPVGLSSLIWISGMYPDRHPSNVSPSTASTPYCTLRSSCPRLNGSV